MANKALDLFYILHRKPYSNTSYLLECFSAQEGRFPVIVKGGAGRKGMSGFLQPFQALLGRFSGRGEIKNLYSVELLNDPCQLKGNNLFFGFYINELMMHFLPREDATIEVFQLYQHILSELVVARDIENALRHFEVQMLMELGYGLNLQTEANSDRLLIADSYYFFQLEYGAVLAKRDVSSVQGHTLMALASHTTLTHEQKTQARRLMKRIIHHYLNGKSLKSRELFQQSRTIYEAKK